MMNHKSLSISLSRYSAFALAAALLLTVGGCQISRRDGTNCQSCGAAAAPGGASPCLCLPCKNQKDIGIIQTGGPLARATSLPLSQRGLTLADAVKETLRDGIRQQRNAGVQPEAPRNLQQPSTTVSRDEATKAMLSRFGSDKFSDPAKISEAASNLMMTLARDNPRLNASDQQTISSLAEIIAKARTKVSAANEAFDAGEDEESIPTELEIEKAAIAKANRLLESRLARQPAKRAPASPAHVPSYYKSVVVLTRSDQQRLIFPLWLVEMYQAGDIALRDGDLIEVMPLNRTEIFDAASTTTKTLRQTSDELDGQLQELNSLIDVLVVSRFNRQGNVERYFVPRRISEAFGDTAGFAYMLDQVPVSNLELIQPNNLDLVTEIRSGRAETLAKSAETFRAKQGLELIRREQQKLQDQISMIPVIGDLCGFVETTTGFNSANAIQDSREGIENVLGLMSLN